MKINSVKATLYLRASVNSYPYIPHLLAQLGGIRCKICAHNIISICEFHENLQREGVVFMSEERNCIYACTVKPCDSLATSVNDVLEYTRKFYNFHDN